MNKYAKHILITLGILLAAGLILKLGLNFYHQFQSMFGDSITVDSVLHMLRNYSTADIFIFTFLLIVVSAIPGAPASIFAIAAGICFGKLLGATVSIIGITLGNLVDVLFLTFVSGLMTKERNNKYLDALLNMRHPRLGLVIGYAVPFIPSFMTSMAAVKMKMSTINVILCAFLGSTPIALIYAFGGDELMKQNWTSALLLILLAVALIFLVIFIFKDRKKIIAKTMNNSLFNKK